MDSNFSSRPQKLGSDSVQSKGKSVLILHNDEINTFEHVMDSLVEVCKHSPTQAEQCAMITHYKGKCDILSGAKNWLRQVRVELTSRGLKTSIE